MKRKTPGFLILKGCELEIDLNVCDKNVRDFADTLDIEMLDAYKLLSGERTGIEISRRFINRYGADYAHGYIDWEAMGIKNPLNKNWRKRKKT